MKKEKTIGELAREHPNKTYNELDKMRQEVGVCIIGKARKDREPESELDRTKTDNNDLYNRVAELMEINESHQKLNGKLQERLTELEEENKKLHDHFDNKIESARKAGL